MKKDGIFFLVFIFLGTVIYAGCNRAGTCDVNKDGKPDVTYYSQGEYISKVEADTNYDGKPDVTVCVKDGKFQSAQADTDYNGTIDKTFTNQSEFVKWLNRTSPEFNDKLSKKDWRATKQF